jgi:MFS family permease
LWPRWKKEAAFWAIFFNTIIYAIVPGPMIAPQTVALSKTFNTTVTAISELSGYQLLVVGAIGPIVSVLAQKYGKRPQLIFAAVMGNIGTAICIAGAFEVDYHLLLGGRMVQGLGMTAWESLSVAAVGDIFYLHQRGWRTALLVAALTCTSSMVAVVAGVMSQNVGYKNCFVALLPLDLAALVATVLLIPETQYRRTAKPADPVHTSNEVVTEKGVATAHEIGMGGITPVPKKTFAQTMAMFSGVYTSKSILHLLSEIFIHLLNPAVIWILLVSGVNISFFVGAAYMTAQIWSPPPYLLTVAQNGYFYTGAFVGGILAVSIGYICDWSARVLSRMNKGVFEAEFRIPVNILAFVCSGLGWFVWMWVMNNPRPNGYLLGAFCYGLVGFGISVPSTSAGLYIL